MKAIQFRQYGKPGVLEYVDIDQPTVTDDTLLIKVHTAALNPIDAKIREGSSFVCQSLTLPSGLGFDMCGEVIQTGKNITGFKTGDIVLGSVGRHNNPCAYADYCLAKPDQIIMKPKALSDEAAAGLIIAGLTAWQAIHDHAQVQSGERVLIHAAAGGVGHLAVQFAQLTGATTIATASTRHHAFLQSLNVDEIIDYTECAFEKQIKEVDVVIDLVGGETGLRSLDVLKPEGRLVTVPTITRDEILTAAKQRPIHAMGMLAQTKMDDLKHIADLIATNQVTLQLAASYSLAEAATAHQALEAKHTQGKLILKVC